MALRGEKTGIFWWGLVIFAASICFMFSIFWYMFVMNLYFDWRFWIPEIFGGVVFVLVGLFMMKSGFRKEKREAPGSTKLL
jgi:putative Mn2+ efflux pump MntP